ncbi:hypothetical protein D3Z51_16345 [Clostridiaceae bacterium]|nr:hypothetical protein [Clostridiaceae bacterium]RKI10429.1 hypothetical protein D7V81_15810 [bacterium 1XD21-70]
MDRKDFMKELEYLLQDIPAGEKEDAIAYYRDYLEDAGDEHEADAIREFGSPERVAAIIRADLGGNLEEGGVFTESGYQDERFRDPRYQVAEPKREADEDGQWQQGSADAAGQQRRRFWMDRGFLAKGSPASRVLKVVLLIAILFMGLPVLLGVGGGIAGIAAAMLALFLALVLLSGILTVTAWIGAVVLLVLGGGMMLTYPWSGVLVIGIGIFVMGLAFLGIAVSVAVYGKLIPFCICGVTNWLNRLLHHKKGGRK